MAARALRIQLLGGFRVAVGERAVAESAWRLRKARSVLKLLALSPERSLHREQAIELLWPDREPEAAANNLRQALYVARRALEGADGEGAWLELGQDVLALAEPAAAEIDVDRFEAAAGAAERNGDAAAFEAALALYGGELLPEDRFEEWTGARREALRERHLALLVGLAAIREREGEREAAIATLQEAVVADPLHEAAQRELIRLYALSGRRQRALAQYHLLRESLRREFEDEPESGTKELYREILARRFATAERPESGTASAGSDSGAAPEAAEADRLDANRGVVRPAVPNNLPLQLTAFVGRERQLEEIQGLVGRTRLITLTGAGGCGKTRLGVEVASRSLRAFADGVWLVELAGLSESELVAHATADALGVESRSRRPSSESIAAQVGERTILLLLDNCEHLVGACAELAESLLGSCPNLKVLATSREPLHIPGEVTWRVPSLALPDPRADASPAELERSESVQLFCERAAANVPGFELTSAIGSAVAEICRRVDGMPLALELAAAQVGVLSVREIAERLRDSLELLSRGGRTAPTRQQTLNATLDWSHELLTEPERALFRRLGVFAGGASLTSVEDICSGDPIGRADAFQLLGELVRKSMVIPEAGGERSRFRLLIPLRQYARDRLAEAGERDEVEARHRRHFLTLAEELGPELVALDPASALRRMDREHDNLRAALRGAMSTEPKDALRLTNALWRYWYARSHFVEASEWIDAAVRAAPAASSVRRLVLVGRAIIAARLADHQGAGAAAAEALDGLGRNGESGFDRLEAAAVFDFHALRLHGASGSAADGRVDEVRSIAAKRGNRPLLAAALHSRGVLVGDWHGDDASCQAALEKSLAALDTVADEAPLAVPFAFGSVLVRAGQHDVPRLHCEETLAPLRRLTAVQARAHVLASLGSSHRNCNQLEQARERLDECLAIFRDLGDDTGAGLALSQLGNLERSTDEHETARELLEESLELRARVGPSRDVEMVRCSLALLEAQSGNLDRGYELVEQARKRFETVGDAPGLGCALTNRGYILIDAGEADDADETLARAAAFWSDSSLHPRMGAWIAVSRSALARERGDRVRARELAERALATFRQLGEAAGIACCEAELAETRG